MRPSTAYRCNSLYLPFWHFIPRSRHTRSTPSVETFVSARDLPDRGIAPFRHRVPTRTPDLAIDPRTPHRRIRHTSLIDSTCHRHSNMFATLSHTGRASRRERTRTTIGLATRHRDWTRVTIGSTPRLKDPSMSDHFPSAEASPLYHVPNSRLPRASRRPRLSRCRSSPPDVGGAPASIPPSALVLVPHATQYSRRLLFSLHFSLHFSTLLPYSSPRAFVLLVFSVLRSNNNKGHEFGPCL